MSQLSKTYDELYYKAQAILDKYNPCQFQTKPDGSISCYASRKDPHRDQKGLCCGGCKHLTKSGCSVKALACKLWLCWEVTETTAGRAATRELNELSRNGYPIPMDFRASKQENFKRISSEGLVVIQL